MSRLRLDILLAENDPEWTKLLKKFLELANHNVTVYDDGFKTICQTEKMRFDLLIMDLSLPIIDGVDIARNIGNLNKDTPIFFIVDSFDIDMENSISRISPVHSVIARPLVVNKLLLKIDLLFNSQ